MNNYLFIYSSVKTRIRVSLLLFSLMVLINFSISCTYRNDHDVYMINPEQVDSLHEMFVSTKYIPLETREDCMISEISNLKKFGTDYFISDNSYIIYIFNKDGGFVSKINRRGRGHGEYLDFEDFDLRNGLLYVLSRSNKMVLVYNLDGDFVKSINVGDWFESLLVLDDSKMLLYSDNSNNGHYNFVVFDYNKEKVVSKYDYFENNISYTFSGVNNLNKCKKDIFVLKPFDYTIYASQSDSLISYMKVDFKTKDKLNGNKNEIEKLAETSRNKRLVRYINSVTKVGDIMYLLYNYSENGFTHEKFLSSVNLKNGKVKNLNLSNERNDEFPMLGSDFFLHDDEMCSLLQAISVHDIVETKMIDNDSLKKVKSTDNPVLIITKLH